MVHCPVRLSRFVLQPQRGYQPMMTDEYGPPVEWYQAGENQSVWERICPIAFLFTHKTYIKSILGIKFVSFFIQYLFKTFLSFRNIYQVTLEIHRGTHVGLYVKYLLFLSSFNPLKTEFLLNNIKIQSIPHRKHITSPLQSPSG
jgi:hypothetical protein